MNHRIKKKAEPFWMISHKLNLIYKMSFNVNISRSAFVTAVDLLCIFVLIQGSPASKICGF